MAERAGEDRRAGHRGEALKTLRADREQLAPQILAFACVQPPITAA